MFTQNTLWILKALLVYTGLWKCLGTTSKVRSLKEKTNTRHIIKDLVINFTQSEGERKNKPSTKQQPEDQENSFYQFDSVDENPNTLLKKIKEHFENITSQLKK